VTDGGGDSIPQNDGFERLLSLTRQVQQRDRTIIFSGNGASAAMASHMALDFSKNGRVRAQAFNDAAGLTALANDLGYQHVFDQPIRWHGRPGDLLVVISSSGRSANVINAIDVARDLDIGVITFTGLSADNPARSAGDLNFYVDGSAYGMVECVHQVLLHAWLDRFLDHHEWAMTESQNMRIAD